MKTKFPNYRVNKNFLVKSKMGVTVEEYCKNYNENDTLNINFKISNSLYNYLINKKIWLRFEYVKTKFPNYWIYIMPDNEGNINELRNEYSEDCLTIEEAIKFQKTHKWKIFSINSNEPKKIINYLRNKKANLLIMPAS